MSRPSKTIVARRRLDTGGGRSGPTVDLPQPDSPTRPSVSPRADREADVVDGAHVADVAVEEDARLDRKPDLEVLDLDRDCRRRSCGRGHRQPAARPTRSRNRIEAGDPVSGLNLSRARQLESRLLDLVPAARLEWAGGRRGRACRGAGLRSGAASPCGLRRAVERSGAARACTDDGAVRTARSAGAASTIRPPYITFTRSHIPATTPRSCVIRISAVSCSVTSSRRRSRICAWMVTSRAVVGSSAISSFGSHASAIAIIARCRIPPENWCG